MSSMMWSISSFLFLSFSLCHPVLAQDEVACLPNPRLTPGDVADVTATNICKLDYENLASNIPIASKGQVFARYRVNRYLVGYNVDHLIPVSMGGANSIENLWPQPLSGEWGWHRKNKLEHRLRKLVCSGRLSLKQAQQEIARDWISAYIKYVGKPRQK